MIRIGVPRETAPGERRVAATPESVKKLTASGATLVVERDAGAAAGYPDAAYAAAGATLGSKGDAMGGCEVVLKIRAPALDEVPQLREGTFLACVLHPDRTPGLLDALKARKVSALALEKIPRISRAQKMDVLSSMANLAGYRAVVEAAAAFGSPFGAQVTAAGTTPPAKALIIGAGVAGLAAAAAAKALGAEVRAFDTRAAAREQVESLGAKFLTLEVKESGEGGGGYAKVMSKEFIEAEMALFKRQAAEVDIVITTALVPGARAPILLPRDVVCALKPGSVIVDMAAEQGGNCELCKPGEVVDFNGVKIIGYTDLASRMAGTASKFFAGNLVHLLVEMGLGKLPAPASKELPLLPAGPQSQFKVDLDNEVVRPALLTHGGELLPPPPPKEPSPARVTRPPPVDAKPKQQQIMTPTGRAWGATLGGMLVIAILFAIGRFAPRDFLQHSTVFILACFVGWQVVWSVTPALHTPLMSVTNAISGIIIVGGMLQIGGSLDSASILGAVAVLFASINVAGGFLVTQRMLKMFRRDDAPSPGSGGHR